jgi:EAL domain-containing protein (putative c-di-GMP-specific phosphodiesterase class I)
MQEIAEVYARALFEVARENDVLDRVHDELGEFADALDEDRVEVFVQPIVSLPQRKRRFFECFSRVRTNDGKIIVPEQYLEVAERLRALGVDCSTGEFGATMDVELTNNGPVTILLDSDKKF